MPIPVSCPSCHASGQVPDEALGHQLTCPVCSNVFVLAKPPSSGAMPDVLGVWVDSARAPLPVSPVMAAGAGAPPRVAAAPESSKAESGPAAEPPPPRTDGP